MRMRTNRYQIALIMTWMNYFGIVMLVKKKSYCIEISL